MKQGTENKLKFKKLQRSLKLSLWECKGLLQSLWDFARDNAPAGDVGRFSDDELAIGIDWIAPPAELIGALTVNGWLDRNPDGILLIHDWPEHCEDTIHNKLARAKMYFADGSTPKLTRLSGEERQEAARFYSGNNRTANARRTHGEHVPDPAIPDLTLPKPCPTTPRVSAGACADKSQATNGARPSVFDSVTVATLKSPALLDSWWRTACQQPRPVISGSPQDRLRIHGAAERALDPKSKVRNAKAMFIDTVTVPRWERITQEQEARAHQRIKELDAAERGETSTR